MSGTRVDYDNTLDPPRTTDARTFAESKEGATVEWVHGRGAGFRRGWRRARDGARMIETPTGLVDESARDFEDQWADGAARCGS